MIAISYIILTHNNIILIFQQILCYTVTGDIMKIEHICENIFSLTNIPIFLYNKETLMKSFHNVTLPSKMDHIIVSNRLQVLKSIVPNRISRLKDVSEVSYFGFKIEKFKIIFGPFLEQEIMYASINKLKERLRFINEDSTMIDNFYDSLVLITPYVIKHLYYSIKFNQQYDTKDIDFIDVEASKVSISQKETFDKLFEEFEYVKRNYYIEDKFSIIISNGDVDAAQNFPTEEIMVSLPQRATNNSLRNAKTRLTILNTLCTRAAIKGGIDVQLGHQISTNYGILIENMNSIFNSSKLTKEIIISYAQAVNDYSVIHHSILVGKTILHIRRNITEKVELKTIAENLFVTKEHLSRQFKKEVGITLTQYIRNLKIIEAKKLLKNTNHSILNIATMLGFANSSHFSNIFKSITYSSPNVYRNKEQ